MISIKHLSWRLRSSANSSRRDLLTPQRQQAGRAWRMGTGPRIAHSTLERRISKSSAPKNCKQSRKQRNPQVARRPLLRIPLPVLISCAVPNSALRRAGVHASQRFTPQLFAPNSSHPICFIHHLVCSPPSGAHSRPPPTLPGGPVVLAAAQACTSLSLIFSPVAATRPRHSRTQRPPSPFAGRPHPLPHSSSPTVTTTL